MKKIILKAVYKTNWKTEDPDYMEAINNGDYDKEDERFVGMEVEEEYYTYSQELTLGDLQDSGGQFDWDDGSYLRFNEVDWDDLIWVRAVGFIDINSHLIYEGDILKQEGLIVKVIWSDFDGGFVFEDENGSHIHITLETAKRHWEIIGNIYK